MFVSYIDLGTIQVLIQVLVAGAAGAILMSWNRIKMIFQRKKPEEVETPEAGE